MSFTILWDWEVVLATLYPIGILYTSWIWSESSQFVPWFKCIMKTMNKKLFNLMIFLYYYNQWSLKLNDKEQHKIAI